MIISPPFLPAEGLTVPAEKWKTDPMMDVVDKFELTYSGVFPIASDRRWHCGMHLVPDCGLGQKEPVRAIADGEVVAYRVTQNAVSDGQKKSDGTNALNSNTGFVLLKHTTDTGEGRTITFYSLYMHLLDIVGMQGLVPQLQPSQAPQNSSPNALPKWLLAETEGVQPGGGKKVYRKDQLGYVGKYHNETHLHFEIFMTEADFTAWFEQDGHKVALGESHPETPASKDYWGHTYFVIPEKSAFVSVPPGMASLNTGGHTPKPFFPALDEGVLGDGNTLYVQTYFSRGERFMRAWIDRGDGTLVALTPDEPIKDKFDEYEYQLYERATKLYEACPSDGYEMLRFGRILSTDTPTLPAEAQATWLAVPFDQGKVGYIDVNQQTVKKLSDANFPFFMDWQKIEDGNTPFDQAGLCGYDELCRITGVTDLQSADAATLQEFSREESLKSYVQGHAAVRAKLKGFICHAKSEWDASNNEARYGGLKEPEGFFGKRKDVDPDGYTRFIDFVKQSQFMGQLQAPLGEGNKLWFFHPLAFIRHFRKCGWLSATELAQCVPRKVIDETKNNVHQKVFPTATIQWNKAFARAQRFAPYMNRTLRKYAICNDAMRLAYFFGNTIQETTYLTSTVEGGGPHTRYAPWYGRGVIQLTFEENYKRYGDYRGWTSPAATYRDSLETDLEKACDSAGFYWVTCAKPIGQTYNINRSADTFPNITQTTLTNVCNGYDYHSKTCSTGLSTMDFRASAEFERSARAVNTGNPNSTYAMNGLVPRTNVFLSTLAKITDVLIDYADAYAQKN
jgi:predicted chitinase